MTSQDRVDLVEGDITHVKADAIVSAANTELSKGGGVCGAIFKAAGVDKLTEAERLDMHIKLVAFDRKTADCLWRHLESSAH